MFAETLLGLPLAVSLFASSLVLLIKAVLDVNAKYKELLFTTQFHHYRLFTEPRLGKLFQCAALFAQLRHCLEDPVAARKKGDEIRDFVLAAAPFFEPELRQRLLCGDYAALEAGAIDGILELLRAQTPPLPEQPYVLTVLSRWRRCEDLALESQPSGPCPGQQP